MKLIASLLVSTAIILTSDVWAKEEQTEASTSVHEYQLKNGLKLLVKEDHRAPVAITQVWYKVGSSYEPNGITGVSHALEHMMFKGTPLNPGTNFFDKIADVGGEQNAFTAYDFTSYWQKLSADKLALSFELEADRMANASLPSGEFDKEIEVVKEERHLSTDNNPQSLTFERFAAAAYLANPYHHPVIGWQDDLDNMTVNDVKNWYKTWYVPNNATVVVVGDVNPKAVYELAEKYFGPVKASPLPTVKPHRTAKPLGPRSVTVKAPAKLPYLIMGYNTPSVVVTEEAWEPYALEVLSGILNGGESSRLQKELVRKHEIAGGVETSYDLYSRLPGLFIIGGMPAQNKSIEQLQEAFNQQIKNIQENPVSSEELERVKAQTIASKTYAQDSITYQAIFMGSLVSVGLPWQEMEKYPEKIQAITKEQVQQVAKKYLVNDRLTIAVLDPQSLSQETAQN